jgi:lipopolysaccharide biosynthesis glycosyltransferase
MLRHFVFLHCRDYRSVSEPFQMDSIVLGAKEFAPYRDKFTGAEPRWLKCHLLDLFPDYDRIIYLDADTFTVVPWAHMLDDEADFSAVLDPPEKQRQQKHPKRKQFRADWYFNSGVFSVRRTEASKRLMSLWWEFRKRRWDLFVDQDALNRALHDLGAVLKVQTLPPDCNVLLGSDREIPARGEARVLHWAGVKNEKRFREMRLMSLVAFR